MKSMHRGLICGTVAGGLALSGLTVADAATTKPATTKPAAASRNRRRPQPPPRRRAPAQHRHLQVLDRLDRQGCQRPHLLHLGRADLEQAGRANRDPIHFLVVDRKGVGTKNEVQTLIGYTFKKDSKPTAAIDSKTYTMIADGPAPGSPPGGRGRLRRRPQGRHQARGQGHLERGTETTDTYTLAGVKAAMAAIERRAAEIRRLIFPVRGLRRSAARLAVFVRGREMLLGRSLRLAPCWPRSVGRLAQSVKQLGTFHDWTAYSASEGNGADLLYRVQANRGVAFARRLHAGLSLSDPPAGRTHHQRAQSRRRLHLATDQPATLTISGQDYPLFTQGRCGLAATTRPRTTTSPGVMRAGTTVVIDATIGQGHQDQRDVFPRRRHRRLQGAIEPAARRFPLTAL